MYQLVWRYPGGSGHCDVHTENHRCQPVCPCGLVQSSGHSSEESFDRSEGSLDLGITSGVVERRHPMIDLERSTQYFEYLTGPFVVRDQHCWRSKTVDPVVQESLHHGLMLLVLDGNCHTISAEVTLDPQDVLSSIR